MGKYCLPALVIKRKWIDSFAEAFKSSVSIAWMLRNHLAKRENYSPFHHSHSEFAEWNKQPSRRKDVTMGSVSVKSGTKTQLWLCEGLQVCRERGWQLSYGPRRWPADRRLGLVSFWCLNHLQEVGGLENRQLSLSTARTWALEGLWDQSAEWFSFAF